MATKARGREGQWRRITADRREVLAGLGYPYSDEFLLSLHTADAENIEPQTPHMFSRRSSSPSSRQRLTTRLTSCSSFTKQETIPQSCSVCLNSASSASPVQLFVCGKTKIKTTEVVTRFSSSTQTVFIWAMEMFPFSEDVPAAGVVLVVKGLTLGPDILEKLARKFSNPGCNKGIAEDMLLFSTVEFQFMLVGSKSRTLGVISLDASRAPKVFSPLAVVQLPTETKKTGDNVTRKNVAPKVPKGYGQQAGLKEQNQNLMATNEELQKNLSETQEKKLEKLHDKMKIKEKKLCVSTNLLNELKVFRDSASQQCARLEEIQPTVTDLTKAREHMKQEREDFSQEAAEMEHALKEAEALLL
ncbi:hypothetical protein F7725_019849 [Dissostichus mawsoni]|uniref:Uncharacterized protein n=1 Tax=Dissostichus mawsoni TaxID=36200 RepID=A0A7J5YL78_DISMA|nr:hypothetical protein F7725_019849 [Dissostichus mawsoni]